ncbi:uncharacterized protein [Littorina saxatilis]|uniref:Uncharacterized protein n=1 Tax=Littorina saxatilis TaxID=31220 RepID=A0AAN9G5A8_9CAEN
MACSLRLACVCLGVMSLVAWATAADLHHGLPAHLLQQASDENTVPHSRSKRWSGSKTSGFSGTGSGSGSGGFFIPVYQKTGVTGNSGTSGSWGSSGSWGVPMTGRVPFSGAQMMSGGVVPFSGTPMMMGTGGVPGYGSQMMSSGGVPFGGTPMMMGTGGVPFSGGFGAPQPASYIKQVSYFPQPNAGGVGSTFGGFGGNGFGMGGGGMMID